MDTLDDGPAWAAVTRSVAERLAVNKRVRRSLPGEGRLRFDRQLPFLCLYRRPPGQVDLGTQDLVTTEAAYLFASGDAKHHAGLAELCNTISTIMLEHFGIFLLLELWSEEATAPDDRREVTAPRFSIVTARHDSSPRTLDDFKNELATIRIHGQTADVDHVSTDTVAPPRLRSLPITGAPADGFVHIGLGVRPIFRSAAGTLYPLVLQRLRHELALALRKSIYSFTAYERWSPKAHFHALGPTSLVKAVRLVDQELSEVSESFDFLLQVTPLNSEQAWAEFAKSGYQGEPVLRYRPLPYRPGDLKRRLFKIPIERVEDATLAHLFWEKQEELDRQITALRDIGTSHFLHDSLQLYGRVDDGLHAIALGLLDKFPHESPPRPNQHVRLIAIVAAAREHLDHYHQQLPAFGANIEVCDDLASGLLVARDRLYISKSVRLRRERLEAVLSHEVGTHLLTYFNGRQQQFRQLYAGLAGYEELQEGLAVLAEFFVGGLTRDRLRTLAGRVVAVRSLIVGNSFAQTYHLLCEEYQFSAPAAFFITVRVYRAGGLTKDAIYLRGLRQVLNYLSGGHDMEPLYVGKIGLHHLPYIQELRRRGVIQPATVLPRFLEQDGHQERLDACRSKSIVNLMELNDENRNGGQ